jgi:hypothetical protein
MLLAKSEKTKKIYLLRGTRDYNKDTFNHMNGTNTSIKTISKLGSPYEKENRYRCIDMDLQKTQSKVTKNSEQAEK